MAINRRRRMERDRGSRSGVFDEDVESRGREARARVYGRRGANFSVESPPEIDYAARNRERENRLAEVRREAFRNHTEREIERRSRADANHAAYRDSYNEAMAARMGSGSAVPERREAIVNKYAGRPSRLGPPVSVSPQAQNPDHMASPPQQPVQPTRPGGAVSQFDQPSTLQPNAFGLIGATREERIQNARETGRFDPLRDEFNRRWQSQGRIMDFDGNILVGAAAHDFISRNQADPVPRNDRDQALLNRGGRPIFDSLRPSSVFPS